jgi:hypothetical protein
MGQLSVVRFGGVSYHVRRKAFFFEKKKQKTFAFAPFMRGAALIQLARNPTQKSFWFFF